MRCRSTFWGLGLVVCSAWVVAHPNPEIAAYQEEKAGEKFNTSSKALGVEVRSVEVLLQAEKLGYAIRKPLVSPDGKWIAITNPEQDVLSAYDTGTSVVTPVARGAGVGTDYVWDAPSGALLYRKQKEAQRQGGYEVWRRNFADDTHAVVLSVGGPLRLLLDRATGEVLVTNAKGELVGPARDEEIRPIVDLRGQVVRLGAGVEPEVLSDPEEQCFDVQHAPQGDVFIYSDVDTLKLRRRTGEPAGELGYGHHARWAPNGSCLVFQVTYDDGHTVVKSELAVSSPDGTRQALLTATDAYDEVEPCWMPDGLALLCACEKTGNLLRLHLDRPANPSVQGAP